MRYLARIDGRELGLEIESRGRGRYAVRVDGLRHEVERHGDGAPLVLSLDGRTRETVVVREGGAGPGGANGPDANAGETPYDVAIGGKRYSVRLVDPVRRAAAPAPARKGPVEVRAVMPGKIVALLALEGQEVTAGQGVVVVEAMKMENELPAPKDGRVTRIRVRPGDTVEAGAALFTVE